MLNFGKLECWESGQVSVLLWSFGNNGTEGMGIQSCFHQEEKTVGTAVQAGMEHQGRICAGSGGSLSWWRPAALGSKGVGSSLAALIGVSCDSVPAILSSSTSGFHHIFCLFFWLLSYAAVSKSIPFFPSGSVVVQNGVVILKKTSSYWESGDLTVEKWKKVEVLLEKLILVLAKLFKMSCL